jgi:CheY-like chemotaxis protein
MSLNNVLVVDDSRTSRMLISAIILDAFPDIELLEAASAEEALVLLDEQIDDNIIETLDIATVDLHMPGMNGLELADILRRRFPNARLGMLTSDTGEVLREAAEALGLSFLEKPINEQSVSNFILGHV